MRFLILSLICIFVLGTLVYLFFPEHSSTSNLQHTFFINKPFPEVRKPLVRKDVLETMVSMSHGRVISKEWDQLDLSVQKIVSGEFTINGRGRFIVEIEDRYAGKIQLEFYQIVYIDKRCMKIQTRLVRPSSFVSENESYTYITGDGNNTKIYTQSKLVAKSRIPMNFKNYMDQKVYEANLNSIQNMEICIRQMTSEPKSMFKIPIR